LEPIEISKLWEPGTTQLAAIFNKKGRAKAEKKGWKKSDEVIIFSVKLEGIDGFFIAKFSELSEKQRAAALMQLFHSR
jgi:hypothetical protein